MRTKKNQFLKAHSPSMMYSRSLHWICVAFLFVCFIWSPCQGDENVDSLLPSDAPMTMMDRITTAKATSSVGEVRATTSLGTIIGLKEQSVPPHITNTHHYSFRGIPYVKPPIGDLRFKDPVEYEGRWSGEYLNATKLKPFCPQYNVQSKTVLGEEDCLYLNVFTPVIPGEENTKEKELLPVFVFIHGGAFIRGSSSAHGAEMLLARDMVVVTFNYRIGMLGFMSTDDSILPGNYGMLDQVSALRWVHRHISEFGGDPKRVTLGGFSAGAVSVHLHMHSPLSKDLFHRGLMLSGSAFCPWGLQKQPRVPAKLVASKLSCPTSPSSALATCIASKDYRELVKAQASIFRIEFAPSWIAPIVDKDLRSSPFLPAPLESLQVQPRPSIIGLVPNEGLLFSANALLLTEEDTKNPEEIYNRIVPETFTPWDEADTPPDWQIYGEYFYFSDHAKVSKDTLLEEFTEALTDYCFIVPVKNAASQLANAGVKVYTYMMTYRDPESPSWATPIYQNLWKLGYTSPLLMEGISHGDDLLHLFSFPYAMGKTSQRDQRVRNIMLSFVSNFIATGEPQLPDDLTTELPLWIPVKPHQPISYYNITHDPTMVMKPFRYKEQNFWNNLMPKITSKSTSLNKHCEKNSDLAGECHIKN